MFKEFLRGFGPHVYRILSGKNIFYHLLAAGSTALLVLTGFDWWYYGVTRGPFFESFTVAAGVVGFFVPVVLPVAYYIAGEWRKNRHLMHTAAALAQSAILAWVISSTYKVFTGRIQPDFLFNSAVDISRNFNFGFWEHGIFWGWPSSHTAVAFAMTATLLVLYPRSTALRVSALIYAFFIGVGVSFGIHWFSDFVAGAIIGSIIGTTVARAFRK